MKAVILDYASLAPDDLMLDSLWNLDIAWQIHQHTDPKDTEERLAGHDIVLSNKVVISGALMDAAPALKLIIIMATGVNNVDLDAAKVRGIAVANIVDYSTNSVVQHTFALMLNLVCRLNQYQSAVRQGEWQRSPYFGLLDFQVQELAGKTLGIIGYGKIGRAVEQVAKAFGLRVVVCQSLAPNAASDSKRIGFDELIRSCDIISLHGPLTPESLNLIDANALQAMKASAIVINVGRGGIVDEQALAEALETKAIGGAGIDVMAQEPPAADNPLLALAGLPNLIITPHTAWSSQQARQNLVEQLIAILQSYQHDELINRVI